MRLVDADTHARWISKAELFDWSGPIPQHDSIPGALILSAVQRQANWWRCWVLSDTRSAFKRWWGGEPVLPQFAYPYVEERKVVFLCASVQKGLSVQEAVIESRPLRFDSIAGVEIVAFTTGSSSNLQRVFYHDRTGSPDGLRPGVDPRRIKAGRKSVQFTPTVTDDLRRHGEALHDQYHKRAGKRIVITREAIRYV